MHACAALIISSQVLVKKNYIGTVKEAPETYSDTGIHSVCALMYMYYVNSG